MELFDGFLGEIDHSGPDVAGLEIDADKAPALGIEPQGGGRPAEIAPDAFAFRQKTLLGQMVHVNANRRGGQIQAAGQFDARESLASPNQAQQIGLEAGDGIVFELEAPHVSAAWRAGGCFFKAMWRAAGFYAGQLS